MGLTYRQVDHWERCGYITPAQPAAGSGSRRAFAPHQVQILRLLAVLAPLCAPTSFSGKNPAAGLGRVVKGVWAMLDQAPHLLELDRLFITQRGLLAESPPGGEPSVCINRTDWVEE